MKTSATPVSARLLHRSWRAWLGGEGMQVGPWWLRLVWTLVFSVIVALGFTVLGLGFSAQDDGAWRSLAGWWQWYRVNLVVALAIGLTIHLLFTLGRLLLGRARLQQLQGTGRTLYFGAIPLLGVVIGWPLGVLLAGQGAALQRLWSNPDALAGSVLVAVVITLGFRLWFAAAARQLQAEKRAAEAQLRLLQAQIEPHFLFNTLANVISLIDHDAPRAKQMLESFTDYLRSSLASLRHEDATLGGELALADAYLGLLKTRMEDRLQFSIAVDTTLQPALHAARLPPLLLQPLVENAIHHGLEPKIEGGHVRVTARVEGPTLVLEVADDGLGTDAPPRLGRPGRRGAGMALSNLRERLLARYGTGASLTLTAATPGTVATLRLPFEPVVAA